MTLSQVIFATIPCKVNGEFSNPSNLRENGPVYLELCCHGLLMVIPVQLLTSDLCNAFEVMMTSSEIMDAFFYQ